MAPANTIGLEVPPIDGEDFSGAERFGGGHKRRVCQIHGMIRVDLHQFERARQRCAVEEPDRQPAFLDEFPKTVGATLSGWSTWNASVNTGTVVAMGS